MRLVFLGTSSGVPTLERNVSCLALQTDNKKIWLFDCGEGSQTQFLKAKLTFPKIERIFITHLHGDHAFGVPGLLAMCSMKKSNQAIELIGPVGLERYVKAALEVSATYIPYDLKIVELEPNKVHDLGIKTDVKDAEDPNDDSEIYSYHVTAYPLQHRVPCFGYVIKELPKEGPFLSQKAIQLGVQGNQIPQLLKDGAITLENGTTVQKNDCLGNPINGRHLVILGDTYNSDSLLEAAQGCDVLVHESTFDSSADEVALKSLHSTSKMAGQFGAKANTSLLIITHFSQRYTSPGVSPNVSDLLQQAREAAGGVKVEAANDLSVFEFPPKWKGNKPNKR